jgi:hypothetical protein
MTTALILALRDHSPDAVPSEPLAEPFITVPLVPSHPFGTCPRTPKWLGDTHGIEDDLKLRRVVPLTRRKVNR